MTIYVSGTNISWTQVLPSVRIPPCPFPSSDQIALWMPLNSFTPSILIYPALAQVTPVQENKWSYAQHW